MAKNDTSKKAALAFLLKPMAAVSTGLQLNALSKDECSVIEQKFDERLVKQLHIIKEGLTELLPHISKDLETVFNAMTIPGYREIADLPFSKVVLDNLTKEDKKKFSEADLDKIQEIVNAKDTSVNIILQLNVPLSENILLTAERQLAKNAAYADLIGLKAQKAELFTGKGFDITRIGEADLAVLEKEEIITKQQSKDLYATARLGLLTGENFDLVRAIKQKSVSSPSDLVRWNKADWLQLIETEKITVPPGEESAGSYAENLEATVERSFPADYLLHRVVNKEIQADFLSVLKKIEPVLNKNIGVFRGQTNELALAADDLKSIGLGNQALLVQQLENTRSYVNMYRHLDIAEIINRPGNVREKQDLIASRINALNLFNENNSGSIDFTSVNFGMAADSKKDLLNWAGITVDLKPFVNRQMAAYQRAFILGGSQRVADKLLKTGYDSAAGIIAVSEIDFISASGLGTEDGRRVYRMANDLAIGAAHYMEAIRGTVKGVFNEIPVSNQHPVVNDLKEIDGFDQLFGSQDYCDCEECRSILSPAAYFTDLMYFVQENVSKRVFTGSAVHHPLCLKKRRPDLWKLELSCANTSGEIPYLTVVNDVLEKYLVSELTDVNDVAGLYANLRGTVLSINQPFDLELETLRLYISHFGISLFTLYDKMHVVLPALYREKIKLSAKEVTLITDPDPHVARKIFRDHPLVKFDVQQFISYAGISRNELDDLLATVFLPQISQVTVLKIKDTSDIQKYSEVLQGLTDNNLDLIHRYLRLWKKTPWKLKEFDLVLCACKAAGIIPDLEQMQPASGGPKILKLAVVLNIYEKLNLSVEELAALINELPQVSLRPNQKSFAERIFKLESILGKPFQTAVSFIIAGLGITEGELNILSGILGIHVSDNVSIAMLSKLYKHARIAKAFGITIEDLKSVLQLTLQQHPVNSLGDIETISSFLDWQKTTPLTISEILFIQKGTATTKTAYKTTRESLVQKVLSIQVLPPVVAEQDAAMQLLKKRALLKEYLQGLFTLTSTQLDDDFLSKITTKNFEQASAKALNASFTNSVANNPTDFDDLFDIVKTIERYVLLFTRHLFPAATISFILSNKNAFGIANLTSLSLTDIRNISFYKEVLAGDEDMEPKLQKIISVFHANGNFSNNEAALADCWKQPVNLVKSILDQFTFNQPAIASVREFLSLLQICVQLGIQGNSLLSLARDNYTTAAGVALGAFSSKYDDETIRAQKLEPYTDKLNCLKRDALCDYIISRNDVFKFADRRDLYSFFLLDVEMSGCFRTTWLVAAITSVQLYVYRCLINLEQSDIHLNPSIPDIKVLPTYIPADEWEWRQNYRLWQANREVFLYPENYIDPTLRNTKSHIFKELEDELLQQKITKESAETVYKKYMSQFAELTRLRYAGAYYESVYDNYGYLGFDGGSSGQAYYIASSVYFPAETEDSCYYLFGRTNVMPYQYYYRTYNHYRKTWGNWIKIELAIEAKEISTLIYQGKVYIFWTEVKSKEMNTVSGGSAGSEGFIFSVFTKYSFLNENGKWSAPQRITIGQSIASKEIIYGRIRGTNDITSKWEKEKDAIIEKFQEQVFRKPYSFIHNNKPSTPVGLSHIWTHTRAIQIYTYTSRAFHFSNGFTEFDLPSKSFVITNNDYSSATESFSVTAVFHWGPFTTDEIVNGSIIMSSGSCFFWGLVSGIPINFAVPFDINSSFLPIKESTVNLSLSRNVVDHTSDHNIFDESPLLNKYQKEYNVAFYENGDMFTHVENGTEGLSDHRIGQNKNGTGGIYIPGENGEELIPFNTILTDEITDVLYAKGLEQFLSLNTQEMTNQFGAKFDFTGPFGEYYWEIFFHIPFLIADHFNASQKFKEAKWWYERIFNPTSDEAPGESKPSDHNWQFREFRGLTAQKMKDILTNARAIEAYKKDPFDPHAIAHLRISAYQKTIVMKYIDNLLDWGDYLFTQDTRESINEAEMLYHLAYNILGKKPVKMGKCETADEELLTYDKLAEGIGAGSEFLITLENVYWVEKQKYDFEVGFIKQSKNILAITGKTFDFSNIEKNVSVQRVSDLVKQMESRPSSSLPRPANRSAAIKSYPATVSSAAANRNKSADLKKAGIGISTDRINQLAFKKHKRLPLFDLVKQTSVAFCVPENKDLLAYWTRVEDRLFKIWNCMNIKGIRRSLAMFQPRIDPMMLVRLRASGLSLEDVVAAAQQGSNVPNYRFSFLVEKAKQYAQTIQSFGSSLLSALEKKDMEELTLLKSVHEKNILKLVKEVKKQQIKEAGYQYKSMEEGLANVQNRIDYYNSLIETGLIPWEITEATAKWTATGLRSIEATLCFLSSVFGFLPQVGSPFSMKYGGHELNNGTKSLHAAMDTLATIAENVSGLAGLEASHQRRDQEWKQQLSLAQQEYKQINQQYLAAGIRVDIAERDLETHELSMEQSDEQYNFYKGKFTGLGLYNYMASSLNRLYRQAYNTAFDLAKQAEKAYQFERFASDIFIQNDNWQFDKAGLLSGEKLLLQLQQLEKNYLDLNERKPEISQSFSLALLDASQLIMLRQTGACTIKIPEIAFDMFYPGQYRRVIKSVSLTIPCIAGPFTNISARLTLINALIEENENEALKIISVANQASINTSSGLNDSGMFNLDFRDERYLPFEGAGAISEWKLELPSLMRTFNYDTISDVVLHINYTAHEGDRAAAETNMATMVKNFATTNGLFRVLSFRHDFPNEFNKLLTQETQTVDFVIEKFHFPYFLSQQSLSVTDVRIYLKPAKGSTIAPPVNLKINASAVNWNAGDDIALNGIAGSVDKLKAGSVSLNGDPVGTWNIHAGTNGLSKELTEDIFVVIKYAVN